MEMTIAPFSYSVIASTAAVQIPSLRFTVPDHWIVEDRHRLTGKTDGFVFRCYCEPETGRTFYSLKSVERYLTASDRKKPLSEMLERYKEKLLHKTNMAQSTTTKTSSLTPPDGWIVEKRRRTSGCCRGMVEKFYTEPKTGFKFTSLKSVERYLAVSDEKTSLLKSMRADSQELHHKMDVAIVAHDPSTSITLNFQKPVNQISKKVHTTTAANVPSLCLMVPDDWNIEERRCKSGVKAGQVNRMESMAQSTATITSSFKLPDGWIVKKLRTSGYRSRMVEQEMFGTDISEMEQLNEREKNIANVETTEVKLNQHEAKTKGPRSFRHPPSIVQKLRQVFAENELPSKSMKESLSKQLSVNYKKMILADSQEFQQKRDMATVAHDSSISRTSNLSKPIDWIVKQVPSCTPTYDDMMEKFYYEHGIQHKFQSPKTVEMCSNEGVENTTTPKEVKSSNSTARKKKSGSKKTKVSDAKEKKISFDFTKPPAKIKWFLMDAEGDTWSPFVNGKMVPDYVKRQWAKTSVYLLST